MLVNPACRGACLFCEYFIPRHHECDEHRAKNETHNAHKRDTGKDADHHHDRGNCNPFSHQNRAVIEINPPAEQGISHKKHYDRSGEVLKIYPKSAAHIEDILNRLGFVEWNIRGHTIYHRIDELAAYMQATHSIPRPPILDQILSKIQPPQEEEKKEEPKQ